MNLYVKAAFIASMALAIFSPVFSKPKTNKEKSKLDSYAITFLPPINATVEPKLHLSINIPREFHTFQDLDPSHIIEFVPKTETYDNWTKIITVQTLRGKKIPSSEVIKQLKNGILPQVSGSTIIEDSTEQHKNHSSAKLIMSYTHGKRSEILLAHYFSGPLDCSGYQYTIVLSSKMTEADALKLFHEFEEKNISLPGNA
jgi:hypothetical protein